MIVLITGASRGIGAATAKLFANEGHTVALNYNKSEDAAFSIVDAIKESGGTAKAYKADVSDADEVNEMISAVISDYGKIDALVNNAGVCFGGLLQDVTDADYAYVMDTNVKGAFNACRAVLPHMIQQKHGVIVNVASMWGEVGASYEVLYSMSKAAVIGLTKALAKEVGPSGIRVNCISPGLIDTDMNSGYTPAELDAVKDETPLGDMGKPEDIAKSINFLCSDASEFITGQVIGVNGGLVI